MSRMRSMLWLTLLFCVLYTSSAHAQTEADETEPETLNVTVLTVEDGLPDATIHAILQDRVGFLWVGTRNGLARYDGYGFRVFRPNLLGRCRGCTWRWVL